MDFGSPVAAGINVNPNQAIQTLSGLVGLKQQQQQLQTGALQQQGVAADVQQKQQMSQELQALAAFTQKATKDPTYHNPDGSLNVEKFQTGASAVAPTYGQAYIGQATSNARGAIDSRSALLGLGDKQRETAGNFLASYAASDHGDPQHELLDMVEQSRGVSADPQYQRSIDGFLLHAPRTSGMTTEQANQTLRQYTRNAAVAFNAPEAGQSAPQVSMVQGPQGLVPTNVNPQAPGGVGPVGPAQEQGLAPTDKPAYKQAAAAAAATGGARATGAASSDIERANQISGNVKAAQAGIQTTQQIDDLADQIHSGKFAGWLSKQAAAAGIQESTYARQLLEKDLGIVKTQLTSAAPSDSRAATILSGTPEATSDPQTIHGAMDYVRGSFRQNLSQGRNLSAYKAKHPDLSGFQGADDAFTGGAGPLVHEFFSLKSKEEQAAFYRRNFGNAQEALQFRNQARAAAHTIGLDNADR